VLVPCYFLFGISVQAVRSMLYYIKIVLFNHVVHWLSA
jgi:hypothetical protein